MSDKPLATEEELEKFITLFSEYISSISTLDMQKYNTAQNNLTNYLDELDLKYKGNKTMKNFTLVIDGFGSKEAVQTFMDAINGTVPVDENDVVIARMTVTTGTKYMDVHTDEEVGEKLK